MNDNKSPKTNRVTDRRRTECVCLLCNSTVIVPHAKGSIKYYVCSKMQPNGTLCVGKLKLKTQK